MCLNVSFGSHHPQYHKTSSSHMFGKGAWFMHLVSYFISQRARKFKKVLAKKLVKSNKSFFPRKISFLAVLNFFPVQKIDFWPFLKWQKNGFLLKNVFREIEFYLISRIFLTWTFFNFLARCVIVCAT